MPIVFAMRVFSFVVLLHSENLSHCIADPCSPVLAATRAVPYGLDIDPTAKRELEVTVAARKELGPEHDEQLIAGFLDRIEHELDRRVDERLARRKPSKPRTSVINPANLAISIPIIAVSGGLGGFAGLVLAFAALVTVFLVSEFRS
jgi:hypothetical protein